MRPTRWPLNSFYGDVSRYEHPNEVRTPNIDRIALGYASCDVRAPTRASVLTDRYLERYGFYTASDSRAGPPLIEITIAALWRKEGYRTAALDKWHLLSSGESRLR